MKLPGKKVLLVLLLFSVPLGGYLWTAIKLIKQGEKLVLNFFPRLLSQPISILTL